MALYGHQSVPSALSHSEGFTTSRSSNHASVLNIHDHEQARADGIHVPVCPTLLVSRKDALLYGETIRGQ